MAEQTKSRRKLSSIRQTSGYHFRYFAWWIAFSIVVMAVFDVVTYAKFDEYWQTILSHYPEYAPSHVEHRNVFLTNMTAQTLLFVIALLVLAVVGSHRAGGQLVALKRTFRQIRDGAYDTRLKFRRYDGLGDVEQEFNEMMDVLRPSPGDQDATNPRG